MAQQRIKGVTSHFVVDGIRFLKAGRFEFEHLSEEQARDWVLTTSQWNWQVKDDGVILKLRDMLQREPDATTRIRQHCLVELGENDQALLIYAEPTSAEPAPYRGIPHVITNFRYGVLRGK